MAIQVGDNKEAAISCTCRLGNPSTRCGNVPHCISKASQHYQSCSSADVVSLTDSNFHQEVQGGDVWLIEFYAPWCGHCKNLKPDWEQLATNVKGRAKIGAVDCDANGATCQAHPHPLAHSIPTDFSPLRSFMSPTFAQKRGLSILAQTTNFVNVILMLRIPNHWHVQHHACRSCRNLEFRASQPSSSLGRKRMTLLSTREAVL